MQITIAPTSTWVVTAEGIVARVWQGTTENGVRVHAIVHNVAAEEGPQARAVHEAFREELIEVDRPFAVELQRQGFRLVVEE